MVSIMSWNILAPELMNYFWRSSYGLRTSGKTKSDYDKIQEMRIEKIVDYIRDVNPDILCLQETTNTQHDYLGNMSVQDYIASKLNYRIVSEATKQSPLKYNMPPEEQKMLMSADTGVTTMISDDSEVVHSDTMLTSDYYKKSDVFKTGVGTPFVYDLFESDGNNFGLVNLHVRMSYPSILASINEAYSRISNETSSEDMKNLIILGDMNAHALAGAKELFMSDLYSYAFDYQGSELIDDHVFFGNDLLNWTIDVKYGQDLTLLKMGANEPVIGKRWTKPETRFCLSKHNNNLISNNEATSDHYPILIYIEFGKGDRKERARGLRNMISASLNIIEPSIQFST